MHRRLRFLPLRYSLHTSNEGFPRARIWNCWFSVFIQYYPWDVNKQNLLFSLICHFPDSTTSLWMSKYEGESQCYFSIRMPKSRLPRLPLLHGPSECQSQKDQGYPSSVAQIEWSVVPKYKPDFVSSSIIFNLHSCQNKTK